MTIILPFEFKLSIFFINIENKLLKNYYSRAKGIVAINSK
jgi:hypothetical protein